MHSITEELITLGLDEALLNEAYIPVAHLETLRDRLLRLEKRRNPSFIRDFWQLEFFAGRCTPNFFPDILTRKDMMRAGVIDYAVIIDDIDFLETVRLYDPEVIRAHRGYGNNGITISAVRYGRTNVLTWIEKYFPELLEGVESMSGYNIFAVALLDSRLEVLEWIQHHYPQVINAQYSLFGYFLRMNLIEDNADAFNRTIKSLAQYLRKEDLDKILLHLDCSGVLKPLSRALDDNTIPTEISCISQMKSTDQRYNDEQLQDLKDIGEKLERNKSLASAYESLHAVIEIRNQLQMNLMTAHASHFVLCLAISCHDILITIMAYYIPNDLFSKNYADIAKTTSLEALRFQKQKTYILGAVESKIQSAANSDAPNSSRQFNGKLLSNMDFLKLFKSHIVMTKSPADIQTVRKSFGMGG